MDEDSQDEHLVNLLRKAGHDVVTVNEVGLTGQNDLIILDYSKQTQRLLLTFNCDDFQALHQENPTHPGIIVVYHNFEFSKDMSFGDIIGAIANLEAAQIPLAGQFISLNQWNY